ncbi:MAG: hypothetical protein AB1489_28390 [Acidobacteriota bacterium]
MLTNIGQKQISRGIVLIALLRVMLIFLVLICISLLANERWSLYCLQIVLASLAVLEARNGLLLSLRAASALPKASYTYDRGSHGLNQEFGLYSLALAVAYAISAINPWRHSIIIVLGFYDFIVDRNHTLITSNGAIFWWCTRMASKKDGI